MSLARKLDDARIRRSEDTGTRRSHLRLVLPSEDKPSITQPRSGIARRTFYAANRALAVCLIIVSITSTGIAGYALGSNDTIIRETRREVAARMVAGPEAPKLPHKWDRVTGLRQ